MQEGAFQRHAFPQVVSTGLLTGVLSVLFAISYGTVIFAGPLAEYSGLGINLALFSCAIVGLVIGFLGSYRGTVAGVSDSAVILGLVAAELHARGESANALPTFLVTIAIATFLTGVFLWLLGKFRYALFIRYIPYPVMGGFLGGIGWLMLKGALASMTTIQPSLDTLVDFAQPEIAAKWVPGLILGLLIFVFGRKQFTLATVTAMAVGLALFWGAAATLGISAQELRETGWLLGPFQAGLEAMPLQHFGALGHADWPAILSQLPAIGTIAVATLIGLLLTVASLELTTRQDIDLNHELKAAGLGNILCGLAGGMMGHHYLSSTSLAHQMGGRHRLVGAVNAGVCLAAVGFGAAIFSFAPKFLAGALFVALGMFFIHTWLIQAFRRMTRGDYAVVLIVFATVVFVGFVEGVAVGVLAAGVLFVVNYGRLNFIQAEASGVEWSSNVARAKPLREILSREGDSIYILALRGFLFFGTANRLLSRIRQRLDEPGRSQVRFVIIDFKWARSFDSSVAMVFKRLTQYAEDRHCELCLTDLKPEFLATLEREGMRLERRVADQMLPDGRERRTRERIDTAEGQRFRVFDDLDHGLEWCEENILNEASTEGVAADTSLAELLVMDFSEAGLVQRFLEFAERISLAPGDVLIEEGAKGDDLFFIDTGRVSVYIAVEGGTKVRVRAMGPGTVVGEIAFYRDRKRSASVIADRPTTAYKVTRDKLERMRREAPEVVAAFHELMARQLAVRIEDTTRLLTTLSQGQISGSQ